MKKPYIALLVLMALSVISISVVMSGRLVAQQKPQGKDEPTIVQKGRLTEKQRRHSKEFEGREIPGLDTEEDGDVGIYIEIEPGPLPGKSIINNSDDYLRALACANVTDAAVVGKIVKKASQLTENSRFVFTDYEFEIHEALKIPVDFDSPVNKQITITDPGGAVKVDGRIIFASISREQPLRVGSRYILFLRRLKGADSFRLIGERGIFGINNDDVKPTYYDFRGESGYVEVLQKIRSIILTCQVVDEEK